MSAVAVERDTVPETTDLSEQGTTATPRVPERSPRSRLERLFERFARWSMEHPQTGYPRFILKVSLIGYRLGLWHFDDDMAVTTVGRVSGLPRRAVLGVYRIEDRWYTLDPFGERADWYRNMQADPVVTIQRHGKTWTARGVRLTDRAEALELFEKLPAMRWLLRLHDLPETAEAFAGAVGGPVYIVRWDSVDEPGPPPMPSDLTWIWPVAATIGIVRGLRARSIRRAMGFASLSLVTLVAAKLGWDAVYARVEKNGIWPEGRWARLDAWAAPRLMWWLYDAFDEPLALQSEDDVLDVACGCGTFLRTHATAAHRIAGIDHSQTLIDIAREQNRERIEDGSAEFVVGDVTELPWEDGTFSVVTSNDVGCFEAKAQPAIEEMYRVLRSGGRAVVADDRRRALEDAGFTEVTVEPLLRFGQITKGVKP